MNIRAYINIDLIRFLRRHDLPWRWFKLQKSAWKPNFAKHRISRTTAVTQFRRTDMRLTVRNTTWMKAVVSRSTVVSAFFPFIFLVFLCYYFFFWPTVLYCFSRDCTHVILANTSPSGDSSCRNLISCSAPRTSPIIVLCTDTREKLFCYLDVATLRQ